MVTTGLKKSFGLSLYTQNVGPEHTVVPVKNHRTRLMTKSDTNHLKCDFSTQGCYCFLLDVKAGGKDWYKAYDIGGFSQVCDQGVNRYRSIRSELDSEEAKVILRVAAVSELTGWEKNRVTNALGNDKKLMGLGQIPKGV